MSLDPTNLDAMVRAVLHEGLLLYPYRMTSPKNRRRFTFGSILPQAFVEARDTGDRCRTGCEVVVRAGASAEISAHVHYVLPEEDADRDVALGPRTLATLCEAAVDELLAGPRALRFMLSATSLGDRLWRLRLEVHNATAVPDVSALDREAALRGYGVGSLVALLRAPGAEPLSCADPPADAREQVEKCRQDGLWPVLAGAHSVLAAPIILPDHPRIAPESPGDLYDATEIDEILTLRILTLTDDEKALMRAQPRARTLLERSEALGGDQLSALHGRLQRLPGEVPWIETSDGMRVRAGDRVRLSPRPGGDVMDIALAGRAATILSLEQELGGAVHLAVAVDDDPGRDLALAGHPGHRFFFRPSEVSSLRPQMLVAGVGNIFFGDDGFGVEVVKRMTQRALPPGICVRDFGIRGYDLALALLEPWDPVVLVDAMPRGRAPGTLCLLSPDVLANDATPLDPHALHPASVLALAKSMGASVERVYVLGVEPAHIPPPEHVEEGLSEIVLAAVEPAIEQIFALTKQPEVN